MDTDPITFIKSRLPFGVVSFFFPQDREIIKFLGRELKKGPLGMLVLDAGCGLGQYRKLVKGGYIALDLSRRAGCNIDVVGDLLNIPAKDSAFDRILCLQVLEHVKEPITLLKELRRVLKPGGDLLLTAPQGWGEHMKPEDYFRFTSYGLRHLAGQAGMEVSSIEPLGGFFNYLGNRIQYIPLVAFSRVKNGFWRLMVLPFKLAGAVIFSLLLGPLTSLLDILDGERDFTLNYGCVFKKKGADRSAPLGLL
ncbi:MAG: class I SAM-dependent methyltransferase [Candidatus Omnitrophica bacterium]|nr:class I SAM-dependent methyltransferase [Candidatus Omnitrophota bacterium]